jgi:hypothetical protein
MKTTLTQNLKSIILALILVVGISYVSAWTGPRLSPPDGNASAPINVGGGTTGNIYTQTKSGILNLAHLFTSDLTVTNADGTVTNIPAGSTLVADGANTGKVKWGTAGAGAGGGVTNNFSNMQVFDASGTWTALAGVTKVTVRAWGAGGQGVCTVIGGSGGGGGGYGEGIYTVIENTDYAVQVGQGVGNPYNTNNGKSSFGSLIISNPGGSANQTNIQLGGIGGTSNGQFNITGESGLNANYNGGSSPMGGTFQVVPGGGGFGGGRCASSVTYGAHGRVVVEY